MKHTVYVTPTPVLDGTPISKDEATISEMMNVDTEMRILPNSDVPNSVTKPNIETYLKLEDDDGYKLVSLTNTMIVTEL